MKLLNAAFSKSCKDYLYKPKKYKHDVELFLFKEVYKRLKAKITLEITHLRNVKFQISLNVRLTKYKNEEKITNEPFFNSTTKEASTGIFLKATLYECFADIIKFYDAFLNLGSGWNLDRILSMRLHITKYKPLRGAGNDQHDLPKSIANKKATLNIGCGDNKCFFYCILGHLYPVRRNPQRTTNYVDKMRHLRLPSTGLPMKLKNIPAFEKENSLSINVFGFEKKEPFPLYNSKNTDGVLPTRKIDLLLYNKHYYLIKSLSKLIGTRGGKKKYRSHVCKKCLCTFASQNKLNAHTDICISNLQKLTVPEEGTVKQFTNFAAQFRNEMVIYYDFESYQSSDHDTPAHQEDLKHYPISVAAKRVCVVPEFNGKLFLYTGKDAVLKFLDYLEEQATEMLCILEEYYKPAKLKQADLDFHHRQTHCGSCKYEFKHHSEKRIDHCHLSGKYRGCLCNRCNLTFGSTARKIPCIAHGAMNYDIKLILSAFASSRVGKYKLKVLAKNKEHFLCVYLNNFVFIDSYNFLQNSLSKLAESLKDKGENNFVYTKSLATSSRQFELLLRKGVFCYDYLDSEAKLHQRMLPAKQLFFDKLKAKSISTDDYKHAKKVWHVFKCKTLQDYMEVYLKTDVLLLADIFEAFRSMCFQYYGLDVTSYITLPQYSYDALFKMTGAKLEPFYDIDMVNFIYKGVRGGVSCIFKRHAVANNPYLKTFNPKEETSYLAYWDCVNLYGYCMSKPLPIRNFRFLTPEETTKFNVMNVNKNSSTGYILEVDLLYPPHLHELHNDFPLAPEKRKIKPEDWSPWLESTTEHYGLKKKAGAEKLITSFHEKKNYVTHFATLQLYIELGMQLTRVHKVLAFEQSPWIKEYIKFNSDKRKAAKSKFEQDLFKLLTNSIFGKTLQDAMKKIDFKLTTNKRQFLALTSKPTFKEFMIINDGLAGVHLKQTKVLFDKQISVGFTVLELAKRHMYKFHYKFIKPMYGQDVDLCLTDTDSLLYHVRTKDIYADMAQNLKYFDTSNFDKDHPLFSEERKKKIGTFKDEVATEIIHQFIGLKSKCYAILTNDKKYSKKAKGLKSQVVNEITFGDYKNALNLAPIKSHEFFSIRSFKNNLFTAKRSISGLSPIDDKRYILSDGVTTLAYGHINTVNNIE